MPPLAPLALIEPLICVPHPLALPLVVPRPRNQTLPPPVEIVPPDQKSIPKPLPVVAVLVA